MRFSPDFLDTIRSRISISSVIGRHVQWDRRKTNAGRGDYWACCPFHSEKTPSFHAEDRKGRYHCFGCKASGDIFTFVTQKEGLPFPEAVERLAGEAGLQMPKRTPKDHERQRKQSSLFEIMELATKFFSQNLHDPGGERAREYLHMRGLREEVINDFRLGFAPDTRGALKTFMTSHGISADLLVSAGLLIESEDGSSPFDRFRDRIIFPINDQRGRVIAFGARAMSDRARAKYLNSPETELFDKSSVLYNYDRARSAAFEQSKIIAVEGYMDVILLHQAGVTNAVAALGTALTETHLRKMWSVAPEPILCFDGDEAGISAANRAADNALHLIAKGNSVSLVNLPDNTDPADVVQIHGVAEFLRLAEQARPLFDFVWDRELAAHPIGTPEQKVFLENRIAALFQSIPDADVRKHYHLSSRIWLSDLFWKQNRTNRLKAREIVQFSAPDSNEYERIILGFSVEFPNIAYKNIEKLQGWTFYGKFHEEFRDELIRIIVEYEDKCVANFYQHIKDGFFFVLNIVHGEEKKHPSGVVEDRRGHALFRRYPLARYNPPDVFIERMFDLQFRRLEILAMDRELKELSELSSDEAQKKTVLLVREVQSLLAMIETEEKALAEQEKDIIAGHELGGVHGGS